MCASTADADPFRLRVQDLERCRRAVVDTEYVLVGERRGVQRLAEQRQHGPQPVSPCPARAADWTGPDGLRALHSAGGPEPREAPGPCFGSTPVISCDFNIDHALAFAMVGHSPFNGWPDPEWWCGLGLV